MWLHVDLHTLAVITVNYLSGMSGPLGYVIERRMIIGALVPVIRGSRCPEVT